MHSSQKWYRLTNITESTVALETTLCVSYYQWYCERHARSHVRHQRWPFAWTNALILYSFGAVSWNQLTEEQVTANSLQSFKKKITLNIKSPLFFFIFSYYLFITSIHCNSNSQCLYVRGYVSLYMYLLMFCLSFIFFFWGVHSISYLCMLLYILCQYNIIARSTWNSIPWLFVGSDVSSWNGHIKKQNWILAL